MTDNDVFNQLTSYLNTDVNGDNVIDASDISIVDNNSANSITLIRA